jgi:GDPmannose 4,6-dehydratase
MKPKALITGVTGQDGSYLSELLIDKGFKVYGMTRRTSVDNTERIGHLLGLEDFELVEGDITDFISVSSLVNDIQPDHIYNLAAQSHVRTSFDQPLLTWKVNAEGVYNILESMRRYAPNARFYQASTSEMFGKNFTLSSPYDEDGHKWQDENTPFAPQSPYAVAKMAAHEMVRLYREAHGLYACAGILFNHESERRGEKFVTRKITKYVADLYENSVPHGHPPKGFRPLALGNLEACRDWGHAEDYVYAMYLMLTQEEPEDFVVATGETHTVRDVLDAAFSEIGIDDWEPFVVIDPKFYRPAEVDYLLGSPMKAKEKLGWSPKVSFKELIVRMLKGDLGRETIHKLGEERACNEVPCDS